MLLVSLIGEQPIPNLLPVLHLKPERVLLVYTGRTKPVACRIRRLVSGSDDLSGDLDAPAYQFEAAFSTLHERLRNEPDVCFNLTGGTKIMALAAYAEAAERRAPFVYLESEGGRSLLSRFEFHDEGPRCIAQDEIGALITIDDYLRAHVDGFIIKGPPTGDLKRMDPGEQFERALYDALLPRLDEVVVGVVPESLQDPHHQIEIDLVVRCGNQVGILEAKWGNNINKRGLDQLKMAGEPTVLGTYTAQFLAAAAAGLKGKTEALARERRIHVMLLPDYQPGSPLSPADAERVAGEIRKRLGG